MPQIRKITEQKTRYLWLLLEADPDEAMIGRYLDAGELYLMEENGSAVAAAVTLPLDDERCELKNIAVDPALQGRGYGSQLLNAVLLDAGTRFSEMLVGTTLPTEPFYLRSGFVYSHTVKNFFLDHYPEPIFEGDVQCIDMRYLRRPIRQVPSAPL